MKQLVEILDVTIEDVLQDHTESDSNDD